MTTALDMRDRIAAAAQIELAARRITVTVDLTYAIADRALLDTNFEALTEYVTAIEAGTDPGTARDKLAGDPIISQILAPDP